MEQLKKFIIKFRGAIIGGLIAIIALIFQVYKFLIVCLIILAGIFIGNYIQINKDSVKERIQKILDRW